ncbi:MAG: hypothetical protein ABEJ92_05035 [Halobacteriales archaeon]
MASKPRTVRGYVAVLAGRSRATEDVDVVLEPMSEERVHDLAAELDSHGYWGMAMPLDEMFSMLNGGDRLRIARQDQLFPNFEVWFAANDIERTALDEAITVELADERIRISPIELQIAYKLRLAQQTDSTTGKDFEDALHLYLTFEEQFKPEALERYVAELGVESYYDTLRGA